MKTIQLKHKTHFLWMAMCFLLLVITGCSKDDPLAEKDESKIEEKIIGKWTIEKNVYQETPGDTDTYPGKSGEWIEFKKGGTGTQRYADSDGKFYTKALKWELKGDRLSIRGEEEDPDPEDEMTIIKLTDNELVGKAEGTYTNEKGQTIKWSDTYYLKK